MEEVFAGIYAQVLGLDRVGVPLVGGTIERFIGGQLAEGIAEGVRFTTEWIAENGLRVLSLAEPGVWCDLDPYRNSHWVSPLGGSRSPPGRPPLPAGTIGTPPQRPFANRVGERRI